VLLLLVVLALVAKRRQPPPPQALWRPTGTAARTTRWPTTTIDLALVACCINIFLQTK
jgi:hypothetical protein